MRFHNCSRFLGTLLLSGALSGLAGCGGYGGSSGQPIPVPTSVAITPPAASVAAVSGTATFTAMVGNDYLSRGVNWSLSGAGCTGAACGMLTNASPSGVTYNAPAAVPNPATVILTATSINDSSKTNTAMITVTAAMGATAGTAAVSLTMTDTPPTGIALLSFEVTLSGATLNPGNVDLLAGKDAGKIEVRRLQTDSAILSTANIAPGTFTSLSLKFANPKLTFKNTMGTTVAGCAAGLVCEIKPAGTLNSTINFPGNGLMVAANSPTALRVDVNLDEILDSGLDVDFARAQAVNVQQLATRPAGELDEVDDLRGAVQNLGVASNSFTLRTAHGDFPITIGNNTQFAFDECSANNLSCLQNGNIVEVDAKLMAGGALVARNLSVEDAAADDELDGVIFKIDDPMHFEMVVLDEVRSVNNVTLGSPTVVTLSNARFQVKADGLQVSSALRDSFEGANDTSQLLPGQVVQVRLNKSANPGPPIALTTDRVRLHSTQLTGVVKADSIAPPNFTLDTLPGLFTGAGIVNIAVQTSNHTDFESISNSGALQGGDTVSVRGMLFNDGSSSPRLLAQKVRKR